MLSHGAMDQGLMYDFFSNLLMVRDVFEIELMVVDWKMFAFRDFQLSIFSLEETSYVVFDPFSLYVSQNLVGGGITLLRPSVKNVTRQFSIGWWCLHTLQKKSRSFERKKGVVAGCVLSAGLSDIHESVDAGRDRDGEEDEVGEGES